MITDRMDVTALYEDHISGFRLFRRKNPKDNPKMFMRIFEFSSAGSERVKISAFSVGPLFNRRVQSDTYQLKLSEDPTEIKLTHLVLSPCSTGSFLAEPSAVGAELMLERILYP